jgi:phosphotransferase system HPr-like phosphotransfer protein
MGIAPEIQQLGPVVGGSKTNAVLVEDATDNTHLSCSISPKDGQHAMKGLAEKLTNCVK